MRAFVFLLTLFWASSAWGAQTSYTNKSTWQAALTSTLTDESLTSATVGDLSIGANSVATLTITMIAGGSSVRVTGSNVYVEGNIYTPPSGTAQTMVITLPEAVNGIGLEFIEQPIGDNGGITLTVNSTGYNIRQILTPQLGFFGVVDDAVQFTQVTISGESPGRNQLFRMAELSYVVEVVQGASGLSITLPPQDQWLNQTDTTFDNWTDGDQCPDGVADKSGPPCSAGVTDQGSVSSDLIRTSLPEANAIDTGIWLQSGSGCVVDDWTGGIWDTENAQLVMYMAGGHDCYAGNEMYLVDLRGDGTNPGPTLTRVMPPEALSRTTPDGGSYPAVGGYAIHSFNCIGWNPWTRRAICASNGANPNDDQQLVYEIETDGTYTEWTSLGWGQTVRGTDGAFSTVNPYYWTFGPTAGDPVFLHRYDHVTQTRVQAGGSWPSIASGPTCVFNNRLYHIESALQDFASFELDLNSARIILTSAPAGLPSYSGCIEYNDQLVFGGNNNTLYFYDPYNDAWTSQVLGGSTVTGPGTGVHDRFGWLSEGSDTGVFVSYVGSTSSGASGDLAVARLSSPTWAATVGTDLNNDDIAWSNTQEGGTPSSSIILARQLRSVQPSEGFSSTHSEGIGNNETDCSPTPAPPEYCPTIDATEQALRWNQDRFSDANDAGQYFVDWSELVPGAGIGSDSGDSVYVSVSMKWNQAWLDQNTAAGPKQLIIGLGSASSCSDTEIVLQDNFNRGIWQGYHKCPPSTWSPDVSNLWRDGDIDMQPGGPLPCSFNIISSGVDPRCKYMSGTGWKRVQYMIQDNPGNADILKFWVADEDEGYELVWETQTDLHHSDGLNTAACGEVCFGIVWLLIYNTSRSAATDTGGDGIVWYRDLIIATEFQDYR